MADISECRDDASLDMGKAIIGEIGSLSQAGNQGDFVPLKKPSSLKAETFEHGEDDENEAEDNESPNKGNSIELSNSHRDSYNGIAS